MKLQKIILCAAIALTAFGASLGVLEIGSYLRAAFAPAIMVEIKPLEPIQPPVFSPPTFNVSAPPVITTVPEPIEEPEVWGNTGEYYIVDAKPKGFEDFRTLNVIDHEWDEADGEKVVPVKLKGGIFIWSEEEGKGKDFDFSKIKISGKKISLNTKKIKGVSYEFEGKFVEQEVTLRDEDGKPYTGTVYLKGRLSKWRDGKKIVEAKVRFDINHGC